MIFDKIKKIRYWFALLSLFVFLAGSGLGYKTTVAMTVDELKSQREDIKKKIDDLDKLVDEKKNQAVNLENQIAIFDAKISQIELHISETQLKIDETQAQIDQLTIEIGRYQRMLEYNKMILDESLQILYENKDQSLLTTLLSAKTFSDFVDKVGYMEEVKERVKQTIVEINQLKSDLEVKRGAMNEQRSALEDLKKRKISEQDDLAGQRRAKEVLLEQTKGDEEEFQKQLTEAMEEEKTVQSEIDRLVDEARRKLLKKYPNLNSGSTDFGYPLSGVNRISVVGGDYMDPYYGFGFPHTGIDLYAGQGTPVFSIGDGVVIVAYDSGGGGLSYIAIQHPNGLMSKYLHMSEIFVSSGQSISRGDAIGLSGGSPGTRGAGYFTTGPHLHFEIDDLNGNSVNPHNYLDIDSLY